LTRSQSIRDDERQEKNQQWSETGGRVTEGNKHMKQLVDMRRWWGPFRDSGLRTYDVLQIPLRDGRQLLLTTI
jgi:hypothetical protein